LASKVIVFAYTFFLLDSHSERKNGLQQLWTHLSHRR
jgi:hypothetical protein